MRVDIVDESLGHQDLSVRRLVPLVERYDCLPAILHFDPGRQSQPQTQLVSVRCQ